MSMPIVVTDEMLTAALKKAIAEGLFPRQVDTETYLKTWEGMKAALQAALDVCNGNNGSPPAD